MRAKLRATMGLGYPRKANFLKNMDFCPHLAAVHMLSIGSYAPMITTSAFYSIQYLLALGMVASLGVGFTLASSLRHDSVLRNERVQ